MPKFIIEREIPGLGDWPPDKLQKASQKSNQVLKDMGSDIQWIRSYVTGDKLYCVYIAQDEGKIREHATRGSIPANRIVKVVSVIDPTTGE